jgi:hypothetical protein
MHAEPLVSVKGGKYHDYLSDCISVLLCIGELLYLTTHITLHSDHFALWQISQFCPLVQSALSQEPHGLFQCNAINIRVLLIMCKEGAVNAFLWLADMHRI